MYIKSFGINIDKSKRLWGIILIALLIAIILIVASFLLIFNVSNKENITKVSDLVNAKSYYAEYDIKIISNKNENNYKIKEWYVKDGDEYKFRVETNNKENNFTYLGNKNSIYIKSDEQINSLNIQDYNLKRNNILSISSFIEILNELSLSIENNGYIDKKCCKLKETEENDTLKYTLYLNKKIPEKDSCGICNKFEEIGTKISKLEVILYKEKIVPKQYIIYDINEIAYINIIYNKFSVNNEFDEKIFAF